MNIFSFFAEFDSVEAFRAHCTEDRDKISFNSKRSSHTEHYWIKN